MSRALLTYDPNAFPLYQKAKPQLKAADVLLDVGAGIRPQKFVPCRRHICLEPHAEYCDILRENGVETINAEAPAGLRALKSASVGTAIAIDVIEHLSRDDGLEMLEEMKRLAFGQVVIFTPLGFQPQDGGAETDAWGYQGQRWQVHRSGWTPEDFPGWSCFVDDQFHKRGSAFDGAFFAIWTQQ